MTSGGVIEKIRKLLKLANNNNSEAEASSAMAKAQEMILQYGIDHALLADEQQVRPVIEGQPFRCDRSWKFIVGDACRTLFHCGYLQISQGHAARFVFVGDEINVRAAEAMFAFICDQISKMAELATNPTLRKKASWRNDFCKGCAVNVQRRANAIVQALEEAAQVPSDGRSLALLSQAEQHRQNVADYLKGTAKAKARPRLKAENHAAVQLGLHAGDAIQIQRQTT